MGLLLRGHLETGGGNMKIQLRKKLIAKRAQVKPEQRAIWDKQIEEAVLASQQLEPGTKVMIYLSVGWEINTWSLVEKLVQLGAEIYVPVVQKNPKKLIPTRYLGKEQLVPADFGILEPPSGTSTLDPLELDLILVPGLAFTDRGYRIGFGGGYYDRFLPTTQGTTIGLCYTGFIQDLPLDPWDQQVDFLATEEGIREGKS